MRTLYLNKLIGSTIFHINQTCQTGPLHESRLRLGCVCESERERFWYMFGKFNPKSKPTRDCFVPCLADSSFWWRILQKIVTFSWQGTFPLQLMKYRTGVVLQVLFSGSCLKVDNSWNKSTHKLMWVDELFLTFLFRSRKVLF